MIGNPIELGGQQLVPLSRLHIVAELPGITIESHLGSDHNSSVEVIEELSKVERAYAAPVNGSLNAMYSLKPQECLP